MWAMGALTLAPALPSNKSDRRTSNFPFPQANGVVDMQRRKLNLHFRQRARGRNGAVGEPFSVLRCGQRREERGPASSAERWG